MGSRPGAASDAPGAATRTGSHIAPSPSSLRPPNWRGPECEPPWTLIIQRRREQLRELEHQNDWARPRPEAPTPGPHWRDDERWIQPPEDMPGPDR